MIKKILALAAVFVLTIIISSCSSSSDDPSVSGHGPDGIKNALVCLDSNGNYVCDDSEASTRSLSDGSYNLPISHLESEGKKVLFVVDGDSIITDTNAMPDEFYTMSSLKGKPEIVSIFTTLLGSNLTSEKDFIEALGVSANVTLFEDYDNESAIYPYAKYLNSAYTGTFHAATTTDENNDYKQAYSDVTGLIVDNVLDNPGQITTYLNQPDEPASPPLLQSGETTTEVTNTIFQNIPVDAGTMYFGVGMNENNREIQTGAYCFATPSKDLVAEQKISKGPSQNTETYTFKLIKSQKDLLEELNINGGFSLGLSNVSGSMEGEMKNEYQSHSESVFALIKAEFIFDGYHLQGMHLADDFQGIDFGDDSQYKIFKNSCGDRYLHTITTGGAYYGLLRISATDDRSTEELRAELNGKYGKAGLEVDVQGEFQKNVKESLKNTNVSIKIGSRGVIPDNSENGSELINNLDSFFTNADNFIKGVKAKDCQSGEKPWQNCAYAATFASYNTGTVGGEQSQQQVANMTFVKKLMGLYESYSNIKKEANEAHLKWPDYDWDSSPYDSDNITNLINKLDTNKNIIEDAYNKCATDFNGCTDNPTAQNLQSATEIYTDLPGEKDSYPANCVEYKRQLDADEITNSKDAYIYLSGIKENYVDVICEGLLTNEPKTYIKIPNTSGSTDSLSYNMSQYINPDGSKVTTVYDKILVNVNLNNLEVVKNQGDYQETVSTAQDDSSTADKNFDQANLGYAVDCNAEGAKTNINLDGTNLIFDDNVNFVTKTHPESKYEFVPTEMTWESAKNNAESKGGHLAVIDDVNEYNAIYDFMNADTNRDSITWIGLKRTDMTKTDPITQFQWITTNNNLTQQEVANYFHTGEPNNAGGQESCVHIYPWVDYQLNDLSCAREETSLIEYPSTISSDASNDNITKISADIELKGDDADTCVETAPESGVIRLIHKNNQ